MPINLQGSGNIAEGWGPPPQLHAPELGSLVHAILSNRLGQEALSQKSVSESIKQMNEQRDNEAFLRAAQQAGIIPQGDYSGMDAKSIAALASGIAAQTKDTEGDLLKKAQAGYYNRSPGVGMGGRGSNKIWIPELNGYGTPDQAFQVRSRQAGLLGKQAGEIESQQEEYGFGDNVPSGFGYKKRPDGSIDYARTPEEQASPDFVSPVDIIKSQKEGGAKEQYQKGLIDKNTGQPLTPFFTPEVYKQRQEASALRQKILAQKKGLEEKMMNPPAAATDTGGGGGGGGGPHDDAITKANQIKEDLKLGRIDPDEARAQIKALNIPGLQ